MLSMVFLCVNLLMLLEILRTLEWFLAYFTDVGFEGCVDWGEGRVSAREKEKEEGKYL